MTSTDQNVRLQTLGGRTLEVVVPGDTLAEALLMHVWQAWNVPPRNQQHIFESEVLHGFESIESLHARRPGSDGTPLVVTVITSTQPFPNQRKDQLAFLIEKLAASDSRCQSEAISTLVKVVDVASERELEFFLKSVPLASPSVATRRASLVALARVSPKGHELSIQTALPLLEDCSEFVRLTAVETVAALAPRGHTATIRHGKRLLQSRSSAVRVAGMMVLGATAHEDTDGIMDLLSKCSDCKEEEVMVAACDAVHEIVSAC